MSPISLFISCIENSETGQLSVEEPGSVPVPDHCALRAEINDSWFDGIDADESAKACAGFLTTKARDHNQIFGYRAKNLDTLFPNFEIVEINNNLLITYLASRSRTQYQTEHQAEALRYNLSALDPEGHYSVVRDGQYYIVVKK